MIIKFLNFILSRFGYMTVKLREFKQAHEKIQMLNESVQKSGHLNELIRRRPKVVRNIDRLTTEALTNLTNSQTSESQV